VETNNVITQNIPLLQAKKLSQLEKVSKIVEIDSANIIVQIPKLDENNNWDNKSYVNKKIDIRDFIRSGISTLWKDTYDHNLKRLTDDDLIPVISFNDGTNINDEQIDTRDDEHGGIRTNKVNKSQSVSLEKLAAYVKQKLELVDQEKLNQKFQEAINYTDNQIEHIDAIHNYNEEQITNRLDNFENQYTDDQNNIQNQLSYIDNVLKWLVQS